MILFPMTPETTPSRGDTPSPARDDVASIADVLGAAPTQRTDLHLGHGMVFALGREGQTTLELYPQMTRVSMGDRQLVLPRLPAQLSSEGVVFEDERGLLSVGASGEVLFQYMPSPAPSTAPTLHGTTTEPARASRSAEAESPVSDDSGGAEGQSEDTSLPPGGKRERDETKRILKGRLIAPPTFHANPKSGALIGEFRVAVGRKDDPDKTDFVKVSCFDNPAKESFNASKLQEAVEAGEIATGTLVTVVGFAHPLIRRGKHEGTQLYATVVKPSSTQTGQR
jgi:hypothetical protein